MTLFQEMLFYSLRIYTVTNVTTTEQTPDPKTNHKEMPQQTYQETNTIIIIIIMAIIMTRH